MKKVRNVQCFRVALHGFSMRSTFCLFAEKEVFNHNILTALSPVKNLCVTVWRTDEEQTYCPFCSQIPVADVVLSALIASHADVLRLGTRDKPKKPKNVCVGGYCSYGPYGLQYIFLPESRLSCG